MSRKNRVFAFFNPHFILGGVDTYFYRMICWLRKNNYRTYLLLPEKATINLDLLEELRNNGTIIAQCVERYSISNEVKPTKCKLDLEDGTEVLFFATRFPDYIVAQEIARCNPHLKFMIVNYMLHVKAFICPSVKRRDTSLQNYIFFKLRYYYYRRVLVKSSILFMDNICRNNFCEFYHCDKENCEIIPLGIEIKDYQERRLDRLKKFRILTITRFEFPYKGYIFGLIKQFEDLCGRYENLELNIIGWGDGRKRVEETISGLPTSIKSKINLLGAVEYQKLDAYIRDAAVYVGMGTTLLDAGKAGIPVIAVGFFSEESYSNQLFCENPEIVALDHKVKTQELVERIINLSDDDYESCCKETYRMVKRDYDINCIMDRIVNFDFSKRQYEMGKFEIWCHKIINTLILELFHGNENNVAWVDKEGSKQQWRK